MAESFKRKVALVTGASSGIGKATALAFADAGYCTVIADVDEVAGRQASAAIGCLSKRAVSTIAAEAAPAAHHSTCQHASTTA